MILASMVILGMLVQQPITIEDICRLHAANLASLHSMRAKIEVEDLSLTSTSLLPHFKLVWLYDRDHERLKVTDLRCIPAGANYYHCVTERSNGPSGLLSLQWRQKPEIALPSPSEDAGIVASIAPRQQLPKGVGLFDPLVIMRLRFPYVDRKARSSMVGSFADIAKHSKAVKIVRSDLNEVEIALTHNLSGSTEAKDSEVFFAFDRKHGFMIKEVKTAISLERVESFKEVGGMFLPVSILQTRSGKEFMRYRIEVTAANEPIPAADFTANFFPEWTRVRQEPEGLVHIWGADDKPKQTFPNIAAYMQWRDQQKLEQGHLQVKAQAEAASATAWPWWVWVALAAGLVLAAVLVERHRRRAA